MKRRKKRAVRSDAAAWKLVQENLDLVSYWVRRFGVAAQDAADCRGDAVLGLFRAAQLYRKSVGAAFRTYASHKVRAAVMEFCRRPRRIVNHRNTSLFDPTYDNGLAAPPPEEIDPAVEVLPRAVASLKERDRVIVEGNFGLGTGERRTLKEIGRELGLSESRTSQLRARAFRRLEHLVNRELRRDQEETLACVEG